MRLHMQVLGRTNAAISPELQDWRRTRAHARCSCQGIWHLEEGSCEGAAPISIDIPQQAMHDAPWEGPLKDVDTAAFLRRCSFNPRSRLGCVGTWTFNVLHGQRKLENVESSVTGLLTGPRAA